MRLGDLGRTWEIRCTSHGARVRQGVTRRRPDVTLATDAATWLALRADDLSGVDAFEQRRLSVRGNLDYAIGFEGMFRLSGGRPPLLQIHDVTARRQRISTLTMGHGPDVLLQHGLGGTRASRSRPPPRSASATASTRPICRGSGRRASPPEAATTPAGSLSTCWR